MNEWINRTLLIPHGKKKYIACDPEAGPGLNQLNTNQCDGINQWRETEISPWLTEAFVGPQGCRHELPPHNTLNPRWLMPYLHQLVSVHTPFTHQSKRGHMWTTLWNPDISGVRRRCVNAAQYLSGVRAWFLSEVRLLSRRLPCSLRLLRVISGYC